MEEIVQLMLECLNLQPADVVVSRDRVLAALATHQCLVTDIPYTPQTSVTRQTGQQGRTSWGWLGKAELLTITWKIRTEPGYLEEDRIRFQPVLSGLYPEASEAVCQSLGITLPEVTVATVRDHFYKLSTS